MRVFLTGVGCVGKTTIGKNLAELLAVPFFDLDHEIEVFFGTSIERLQNRCVTMHSYRNEAAKALKHLLNCPESQHCVIALPPSGLMGGYLRAIKKSNGIVVALSDRPENILERVTFYDIDSKLIEKKLTSDEKTYHLIDIKEDVTYFRTSYKRAHLRVDIDGLNAGPAAHCIREALLTIDSELTRT
jgi:shikimate kinase